MIAIDPITRQVVVNWIAWGLFIALAVSSVVISAYFVAVHYFGV
jgi:hypothetical protein